MFLESEENNQEERTNNQTEETERKKLTCPECRKKFKDMRGLTSHARNIHQLEKGELRNKLKNKNWKIISGFGVAILTILTLGRFR